VILTYLDKGPTALNNKVITRRCCDLVARTTEADQGWLTQPYYEKGKLR